MISESRFFKADLLKIARSLERRTKQRRWQEASFVNTEKDIFIAFFVIRKLIESRKVRDKVAESEVALHEYSLKKGQSVDWMNRHEFYEIYDFQSVFPTKLSLRDTCNQLIHSYVFALFWDESGQKLSGCYFCSDRDKDKVLYSISIAEIIRLANLVGEDYPDSMHGTRDFKTGDWIVKME